MRLLSKMALVALLALGLMNVSHAQGLVNPLLPVRGTKEVALSGSFAFEPDDVFSVTGRYGPFLDDARIQVGVEASYFHGDDVDNYTVGGFANYHFPGASQLLPYVGVFLGFTGGDGDDGTSYGVQGGAKYFINSSVAAFAELNYRDNSESDDNNFGLLFGLAIYLR